MLGFLLVGLIADTGDRFRFRFPERFHERTVLWHDVLVRLLLELVRIAELGVVDVAHWLEA